jgi:hypothetical protein
MQDEYIKFINLELAATLLAFDIKDMKIDSHTFFTTASEAIVTSDAPRHEACTDENLSKAAKILARALELQKKDHSIVATLEHNHRLLSNKDGPSRDDLLESIALRVLINSYENQNLRQEEAEHYARDAIQLLGQSSVSDQQWEECRKRLEIGSKSLNNNHETDLRFREAIAGVEMSFEVEDGLQCRNFLAKLLNQISRDNEALNLLLSSFTDYLSTRLSPTGSGPFSTIVFKEGLPRKLNSRAFKKILESIQIL